MNDGFPNLLVATEFPPNASGGGPAVVRQMLKDWPADKLQWWSCLPDSKKEFGRDSKAQFVAKIPNKFYPQRRATRLKASLLARMWAPWATRHLEATIRKCKPDVIWAIPHQWSILPLGSALSVANVPYHISVHDYPNAHHPEKTIGQGMTERFVSLLEYLYRRASSCDAIWHEMAADLERKTGRSADQILHAGVEPEDFAWLENKCSTPSQTIKIAYAGTVVAGDTFARFAESLGRVGRRLSKPIELHFFGAHSYQSMPWYEPRSMIEHGNLNSKELGVALRECDWGFAPMELTDQNARYNRFSLPTKIVSYLAAGLPMISMGHRASTVAALARKYSLGIAVDESNVEVLDDLLRKGLPNTDAWSFYRDNILSCARNEFDAAVMRQRLHVRLGVTKETILSGPH